MVNGYWAKRTAQTQEKLTSKSVDATNKQMRKYYQRTFNKILGHFEQTYNKLLLSIEEGREPTPADLYKLDTYWKMQGQVAKELQALGDTQVELLSKKFVQQYQTIYDGLALKGEAAFNTIDSEMAKQMINQIWCADGKSWSNRIWKNTELLQQALNDNLIECVVAGKKTSELKKLLQEQFGASYSRAERLVRTEMAHIQTQAAKQRYKDYGIEEVEI